MMESTIIDRQMLPEVIISYIHSEKIRMVKENGSIYLSPINEKYSILEKSYGMFSDGKLSSERFIKETGKGIGKMNISNFRPS